MKKTMNRSCHFCGLFGEKCKALEEPVCKERSCSFFETTAEFMRRQEKFKNRNRKKAMQEIAR